LSRLLRPTRRRPDSSFKLSRKEAQKIPHFSFCAFCAFLRLKLFRQRTAIDPRLNPQEVLHNFVPLVSPRVVSPTSTSLGVRQ
jgi:hypothetical protein